MSAAEGIDQLVADLTDCRARLSAAEQERERLITERNDAERAKLEAAETIGDLSEQLQAEYREEAELERRAAVAEARAEAAEQELVKLRALLDAPSGEVWAVCRYVNGFWHVIEDDDEDVRTALAGREERE